uniref:Putative secreted peptide n=1 Tax=Anopheles braziliensis TaxID=58242 RepID=A0A2M3ZN59_9DIPT
MRNRTRMRSRASTRWWTTRTMPWWWALVALDCVPPSDWWRKDSRRPSLRNSSRPDHTRSLPREALMRPSVTWRRTIGSGTCTIR